jgi:ABC-type multidrug transport system fused ATPase/permease subunit
MDLAEELNTKNNITVGEDIQDISFRKVGFSYEGGTTVLNNISFHVNTGEKVAIIGANGSGKTTIVNLLLRFLEPTNGEIMINGQAVDRFDIGSYRSLFAVVSQEPYLFYDTIYNNINLAELANMEEVEKASKQSGASEFIHRMLEREGSKIGKNGAKLSGGEKQKLAVARAIVKDAPIIILDEATSGYDVESDTYLHEVLLRDFGHKTVILITHRYTNLEGLDRVYHLQDGCLENSTNY